MVKTIIFDFDGVIVESTDIKTKAFAELFASESKDSVDRIVLYHKNNMGVSRFDKFRYIYRNILQRRLNKNEFNSLCEKFASLVLDAIIEVSYVRGAQEFLKKNSKLFSFFIVSATPQEEIREIVRRRDLTKIFKTVYGAPLAKYDAVKKIIHTEGVSPCDVLYIGDAMSDYLAAKDNNVRFIARINDNEDIFRNISCLKIRDFLELQANLNNLLQIHNSG